MTLAQYHSILRTNQGLIEVRLMGHLLKDSRILFNRTGFEQEFNKILDQRMDKWINEATCPEVTDENFDPVAYFVSAKVRLYERFIRKELLRRVTRLSVRLFTDDEWNSLQDEHDMEGEVIEKVLQEEVRKANIFFATNISSMARVVFKAICKNWTAKELARELYSAKEPSNSLINKAAYAVNLVRFRYTCYFATTHIMDEYLVLRAFNRSPKLLKRFFDVDHLDVIPDKSKLMDAAFKTGEFQSGNYKTAGNWKKVSKIDFNGKTHSHFVVFRSSNGRTLYDHVTKTAKVS